MKCARTLMMEKSVSKKYWREFVSTAVYTLTEFKSRKVQTKFLLNFGMAIHLMWIISKYLEASVTYWKIQRKENLMQKNDEGIFLGYSTRARYTSVWILILIKMWKVKMIELMDLQRRIKKNERKNHNIIETLCTSTKESLLYYLN